MQFELYIEDRAFKELEKIDKPYRIRIKEKILQLARDYDSLKNQIKRLKGDAYQGFERLRVGDYRVIYKKETRRVVITIVRVGHRKEIY